MESAPDQASDSGRFKLPWFGKGKAANGDPSRTRRLNEDELEVEGAYTQVDLAAMPLSREMGMLLPEPLARKVQAVCIGRRAGNEITVAAKAPDLHIFDLISFGTTDGLKPVLMRAEPVLVDLALEFIYRLPPRLHEVPWIEWLEKKKYHSDSLSLVQSEEQARLLQLEDVRGPAIEAVDRMIKEAISIRASDIHIETYENEVLLRYRIDGILHLMDSWPRRDAAAFIKRIKIMASMDISQEMLPQGGRISVRVSDREFDLRVSCVPVPEGESLVMRLLNKGSFHLTLSDLGFENQTLNTFRRLVEQPHGMLLVSGPTGSGKSTTLYAALADINRPDRKILTVEDPIEYRMHGVVQVQVNMAPREDEKRLTFARALREFLRQDPDVILVGEIRDDETASIAVQAALTGHLLLSTIHTNDAAGIITRLLDRGVESFLIASTLLGGIAQRLVRRICEDCREEVPLSEEAAAMFSEAGVDAPRLFTGTGCRTCHRTGYRGRTALYEVLEVNEIIRALIARNADNSEIVSVARANGMETLLGDGLRKAAHGVVTLEEVKRVCMTL